MIKVIKVILVWKDIMNTMHMYYNIYFYIENVCTECAYNYFLGYRRAICRIGQQRMKIMKIDKGYADKQSIKEMKRNEKRKRLIDTKSISR